MTKEVKQQFTLRITQANPTEMVVILYDMTLMFIEETREADSAGDTMAYREGIRKIRACINELIQSLHPEYEIAGNLYKLYLFCIRRLAYAEVRKAVQVLDEVETVIVQLRDAYAQIAPQNTAAPVMSNTETVYTGLTYGKGALTKDMTNQSSNRGMLA